MAHMGNGVARKIGWHAAQNRVAAKYHPRSTRNLIARELQNSAVSLQVVLMTKQSPSAAALLPYVKKANLDYPYFDQASETHLADLAFARQKRGLALYSQDVMPADVCGITPQMAANPLLALQTIIDRAWFLWRCQVDLELIAQKPDGRRLFPALDIRFCSFCPPSRAGKRLIILAEEIKQHPLLDCCLPSCNGSTYAVTQRKLTEVGSLPLPAAS